MTTGKLYRYDDGQLIGIIEYKFQNETNGNWWGEMVFTRYIKASDGDGYLIETEDGRRGRCALKKKVNKAVSGIPPLYYYHVRGIGPLE
ncbi:MAG: hypothetical protein ABUK03_01220 [Dehalococcoidales bacterium]